MDKYEHVWASMVAVLAFAIGMLVMAAMQDGEVPYVTTTTYGKMSVAPVGTIQNADGSVTCDLEKMVTVDVAPKARRVDDEGQQISTVAWPNSDKDIVLELTRPRGTGSVWSYRTVIATYNGQLIGVGGLPSIGVVAQKIQVKVAVGNDQQVPDQLVLCRSTEVG